MNSAKTMFDKIWDLHRIERLEGGNDHIALDQIYMHDLNGGRVLGNIARAGLEPYDANRVLCDCDHSIASTPGRTVRTTVPGSRLVPLMEEGCARHGIPFFGIGHHHQGVVHVIGPELGLSLPGMTIVCGDSHTCTHGAMGALAWGIGASELYHAVATQTIVVKKPKTMRVNLTGEYDAARIDAMDIILHAIASLGSDFGNGYAVEYAGSVVRAMDMEDRMTICNLTVEFGSEYGFMAPDEKTFTYMRAGKFAPDGSMLEALEAHAKTLATDRGAVFDEEITVDVTGLKPQISWGFNPSHAIALDGRVPASERDMAGQDREAFTKALDYMGLEPGQTLEDVAINRVFIGSCSNGRLSNLRRAAEVVRGKKVSAHVQAWVIPGSAAVKREAEALGLDAVFTNAGFMWGEPGCSLCAGSSGEKIEPYSRCLSTSNRNFIGRQGPNSRVHLVGPLTATHGALAGKITVKGRMA